jgi:hypothetical protein
MNTLKHMSRTSLVLTTAITVAALALVIPAPAQAATSSITAPTGTTAAPLVDIPPSVPTALNAVTLYESKPFTLLSWTAANPGTTTGTLQYHWKLTFVDPACSGAMENWQSYQGTTSRTDALIPVGNDTIIGCHYTVAVQSTGIGQYGTYLFSPWASLTYQIQPTWKFSTVTAAVPMNLVKNLTVTTNVLNPGMTRLTWTNPSQPTNISDTFVWWWVNDSSGGTADPNRHIRGGDRGNTVMLNLVHGNTYTLTIYTEGVVKIGTTLQPAIATPYQDIAITFTA